MWGKNVGSVTRFRVVGKEDEEVRGDEPTGSLLFRPTKR